MRERNTEFKSLQGTVMIARIVDGKRTTIRELGNQTSVELEVSTESIDVKETKSGQKADAKNFPTTKSIALNVTTNELAPDDVALAFGAELVTKGAITVTDELLATPMDGDGVKLDGVNITNLVITDSTALPVTLVEGTDYTLVADHGIVVFNDVASFKAPFKASYTDGAATLADFFSKPDGTEYYVYFRGIDSFEGKAIAFELFKYNISVNNTMQFINEEVGELSFSGKAYIDYDRLQTDGSKFDGYGRVINIVKTPTP